MEHYIKQRCKCGNHAKSGEIALIEQLITPIIYEAVSGAVKNALEVYFCLSEKNDLCFDSLIDIKELPQHVRTGFKYARVDEPKTFRELISIGRKNLSKYRNVGASSIKKIDMYMKRSGFFEEWRAS